MIDFNQEYVLENKMVRLSPLKESDLDNLIHFSISEPELWTYSLIQANTPERMKAYINKAIEARKNKNTYAFTVYDKRTNKYAGSTRFYDIKAKNSTLQLGFTWYGQDFQGTGINKNCKYLLLEFAFGILKMERVELRADNENQRSISAMKSIGCIVEGVLRSNTYKPNGGRRDSIVLSILKEEWDNTIKKKLKEYANHQ
jgi:RimJ/RimL family protein N-acetyltransferase